MLSNGMLATKLIVLNKVLSIAKNCENLAAISKDEQQRAKAREQTPHKRLKLLKKIATVKNGHVKLPRICLNERILITPWYVIAIMIKILQGSKC